MTTPVEIGQLLAGKYRVERVLGQGGMGVVVAATHVQLEQRVAVKFLLPEATAHPQSVARFLREARAAVRIQSEFVARVIDVGTLEETQTPYMVMEYLEGQDLEGVIRDVGPLPVPEAVEYTLQACAALAEAHSLGIVHRDLKPANLFRIVRADGAPVIKVLDFGISKMALGRDSTADASLTATSAVLGTPMYMSPEQIRSTRDVDQRTDIWALGSILHELLSGAQPFHGDSLPALFASILEAQPVVVRSTRPDVPEELEQVIQRCLAKKPEERYANMAQLAGELVPFGPPNAADLATRAARLLGLAPGSTIVPRPSTAPGKSSTVPPTGPGVPAQTGVAWGSNRTAPAPSRALVVGAISVTLVAGAAIAGFVVLRGGSQGADAASAPSAATAVAPEPAKSPEPVQKGERGPAPPPPAPSPAPPAPSAGPAVEPSLAPATIPTASAAAPPRRRAPVAPSTKARQSSPTPPPAPTTREKANPLDIDIK